MDFLFKSELTRTQIMIANFIYENSEIVSTSTISQLADLCFVTPSQITKYCQKIELTGFKQLREKLINYNINNIKSVDNINVLIEQNIKVLENINYDKFYELIDRVQNAENIFVYSSIEYYNITSFFIKRLQYECESKIYEIYDIKNNLKFIQKQKGCLLILVNEFFTNEIKHNLFNRQCVNIITLSDGGVDPSVTQSNLFIQVCDNNSLINRNSLMNTYLDLITISLNFKNNSSMDK